MTGKDVLSEKYLLEKSAAIKRLEFSPLGKELKKQTSVAGRQYQKFDNAFESNYFTFYKYSNIKEFAERSLTSKLNGLKEFSDK